jgi:alanyl-tRNA synthetase
MIDRFYYTDAYLREFRARIVETSPDGARVYLSSTAFYPTSGGQPHDLGFIDEVPVLGVEEDGARIAHIVERPVLGIEVNCRLDWPRRFDHMQQHTGQHLLSAVLVERRGISTVSFHMGEEASTIDIDVPSLDAREAAAIERRVNDVIFENRPVRVSFQDSDGTLKLRKPSKREGTLRIVTIEGIDQSACGGTHVRATGEIGALVIRKLDKVHGHVRVEFLCGGRAVSRARADYEALTNVSRLVAAPLDETSAAVEAQLDKLREIEKSHRRLAIELAQVRGRELYAATEAGVDGIRRHIRRLASGALDDELRTVAQSFTAQPKAQFVALLEDPPSILLAVSADSGIHAGQALKAALAVAGGRGGGNATLAQGSVADRDALERVAARVTGA